MKKIHKKVASFLGFLILMAFLMVPCVGYVQNTDAAADSKKIVELLQK